MTYPELFWGETSSQETPRTVPQWCVPAQEMSPVPKACFPVLQRKEQFQQKGEQNSVELIELFSHGLLFLFSLANFFFSLLV